MICIVMSCPIVRRTRERSAYLIEYFQGATLGARKTEALLSSAQHPLMGKLFILDHDKAVLTGLGRDSSRSRWEF